MQNIEEIYRKYFKTVYKYLFCLTKNHDLSEELTQETFYKAVKNIDNFKNECKMSVWLCQIGKNLWYNELKQSKRNEPLDEDTLSLIQKHDSFEKSIEGKLEFLRKIERFDGKTKEIIYLRTIENFSFKEIASIIGGTETCARVTFYRCKKILEEVEENERKKRL